MKTFSKWLDDLEPDMAASEAASHAISLRMDAVREAIRDATKKTSPDPEVVHQLRVATRRATAALGAFKPSLKRRVVRKLRQRLRRIRSTAGECRDWDIISTALLTGPPAPARHVDSLAFVIARLEKWRRAARLKVAGLGKQEDKLQRDAECLLNTIQDRSLYVEGCASGNTEADGGSQCRQANPPTLRDAAQHTLTDLIAAMREAAVCDLSDLHLLHQLRLASKRLRYAMEIFAACYGPAFRGELYSKIETIQQMLGDINDSSQIVRQLDSLSEKAKNLRKAGDPKADAIRSALAHLRDEHTAQLSHRHQQFLTWWNSVNSDALFASIAREMEGTQLQLHDAGAGVIRNRA
jgi:CHAD domain-containing protein